MEEEAAGLWDFRRNRDGRTMHGKTASSSFAAAYQHAKIKRQLIPRRLLWEEWRTACLVFGGSGAMGRVGIADTGSYHQSMGLLPSRGLRTSSCPAEKQVKLVQFPGPHLSASSSSTVFIARCPFPKARKAALIKHEPSSSPQARGGPLQL